MSCGRTVSLVETTRRSGSEGPNEVLLFSRLLSFVGFVHVLDVSFEHEEVGSNFAIDLQSTTIIPLDGSLDFLTVHKDDNHQRVSIDLLLVIEDLGIGFHWRRCTLSHLNWGRWRRTRCSFSSGFAARTSLLSAAIGSFSERWRFPGLSLHFGERGSNKFPGHVILPPISNKTGF